MNTTNSINFNHESQTNIVWVFTEGNPSIEKGVDEYDEHLYDEHLKMVYDPKPLPEEAKFKYVSHGLGKTFTVSD